MTASQAWQVSPIALDRALHDHHALLHATLRRWQVCVQASVVFGLIALVPLIPGAHRLVRVTWQETVGWTALLIAATWTTYAIYLRVGFDHRAYTVANRVESTIYSWVPAMLVAESGSAASFWWVLYFALGATMALEGASGWYEPALTGLAPVAAGLLLWRHTGSGVELVECLGIAAIELIFFGLLAGQTRRSVRLEAERNLLRDRVLTLERDRERVRIAGDLHDGLGGELTAIVVMGQVAMVRHPEAAEALGGIVERARQGIAEVRAAVWSARSADLSWADQCVHLRAVAESLCEPAGIAFVLETEGEPALTLAARHHLVRVLQELVHNAVRHAGATRIVARLGAAGGAVSLTVRDDGPGIPLEAVAAGRGLAGLSRRAAALGGRFEVTSDGAARLVFPDGSAAE